MRLPRKIVCLLSGSLVGFMLLAQAAFATHPCAETGMSIAPAIAQHEGDDCCGTMVSATKLCVAKCGDAAKLSAHADIPVPPPSSEPILTVEIPDVTRRPDARLWLASSGLDPPKTVRFCSLLI